MAIKKNKESGIWWVDLRTPSGERIRRSTKTVNKKEAQEYHDRLKSDLWREDKLGEQTQKTFADAAIKVLKTSDGLRDMDGKKRHIAYWKDTIGADTLLSNITADLIFDKLPTHRTYKYKKPTPLKAATKNRYLSAIHRILTVAHQSQWITHIPHLEKFEEPKINVRWETPKNIKKIIANISMQWLRDVSLFAVSTGMRANEVLSLTWQQINIKNRTAWVETETAKGKVSRTVPLNDDAMNVIRSRLGKHHTLVFTRKPAKGRQPSQISEIDQDMFKAGCDKAGVVNFRFHDLRHTWASWHAQAGTPLAVLQVLGGWEKIEMVQKYAHLAPSHLDHHAKAVTFWSQQPENKEATA